MTRQVVRLRLGVVLDDAAGRHRAEPFVDVAFAEAGLDKVGRQGDDANELPRRTGYATDRRWIEMDLNPSPAVPFKVVVAPARPTREDGVESAFVRYLLSLTPKERLEVLRQAVALESARRAANP